MLSGIAAAIRRYVTENFNDLLKLDLHWARILGAPAPFTLSAYAYKLEQEGKLSGKIARPIIDKVFGEWIMKQKDHCKADYEKITAVPEPATQPATEATTNDTVSRPAQEDNGQQPQETSQS